MNTFTVGQLEEALNITRFDTKKGLCDVFTTKLERLAAHIRSNYMTPFEAAELLSQEAEKMRSEMRGDHHG